MFHDRIDALEGTEHVGAIGGAVLDEDEDAELQGLVREAAAALGAPLALVSLVLRHLQLFRAHVGLPPELAVARATDRCVSFCQFVVRDRAPFEVTHASRDERVPQVLTRTYGVQAYLGMPLWVGGSVVGSLCVLDVVPRTFREEERRALRALADRASARLAHLSTEVPEAASQLLGRAAAPSFGEIRNVLTALTGNVVLARVSAAELAARLRLDGLTSDEGGPTAEYLLEVPATVGEIQISLGDIESTATRISTLVAALEELNLPSSQPASLLALLRTADHLAHHMTKLVGGVRLVSPPEYVGLAGRGGHALPALAALLSMVASRMVKRALWSGLDLRAEDAGATLTVDVRSPLSGMELDEIAAELRSLLAGRELALRVDGSTVRLEVSIAPSIAPPEIA